MKKGFLYSLGISLILLLGFIYMLLHAFEPEYDKVEIEQNIGGILICNSVYNSDIHDWQYDINYEYHSIDNKIYKIGNGTYHTREWNRNEQLKKYSNWYILKTGDWYGTDKVIIGNFKSKKWKDYEFTPDNIENETLWKELDIKSLKTYLPSECIITKINNGFINVNYKFRIDETKTKLMDERNLIYEIDKESGKPYLKSISK
jgi:hypothetical protein